MTLWGFELTLLIAGIAKMVKDLTGWTDKQISYLTAGLSSLAFIFVSKVDYLVALWPPLGDWGPIVLGAIAVFLTIAGYMPEVLRAARYAARKFN